MKIAVSGKGGVGKTTLSAMLTAALSRAHQTVIALDADPDANLAAALGLPAEKHPTFLADMTDLIKERTGAADAYGGYFKLNPKVDDIPDDYACKIGNIRLLALGGVIHGGDGCICPATALVKALLTHLIIGRRDALVMDMDAGIEHLGRGTTQSMDALIVVVDEGPWSQQTAQRVRGLAEDIGVRNLVAVANRVSDATDLDAIRDALDGVPLIGSVPFDNRMMGGIAKRADEQGLEPSEAFAEALPAVEQILQHLQEVVSA